MQLKRDLTETEKAYLSNRVLGYYRKKTALAGLALGQEVEKQFPIEIDSRWFTPIVKGKIVKLMETQDGGWGIIERVDGTKVLVCLG